jgi:hypothetical protein
VALDISTMWRDDDEPGVHAVIVQALVSRASIPRGFTYAVAFHGFDEPPTDVLIGGGAPKSLKQEIKKTINGALAGSGMRVRIASPDEGYGGDSPQNIVNRLTAGGGNASRSSKVSAPAQATGRTSPMRSPRSTIAGLHSFTLIPRGALLAVPLLAMLRCHGETIGERLVRDLEAFHCLPPAPYDACEKKAGRVRS